MFARARTVFTLAGIEVRLSSSWVVIAAVVVWSFQSRWGARFGEVPALAMAVAGAILFFVSLLAHEMAHALEARHRGIEVEGITLFLLGGVTEMRSDALRPRDEFAVAAVGPFVSLVMGAVFGLLATLVEVSWNLAAVAMVLGLLGWLNVALAVFNLLPASPLDGGRVLRSGVWALFGDRRRAIVASARAGQGLALVVVGFTVLDVMAGRAVGAMVNLLIAWFLWSAASSEIRHIRMDRLVAGVHAGALDLGAVEAVDADAPLAAVATQLDPTTATGVRPVADRGEVIGALLLGEVLAMHPADQTFRVARDLMRPASSLVHIARDTPLWDLIETLRHEPLVLIDLDDGRTTTLTARQCTDALARMRPARQRPAEGAS